MKYVIYVCRCVCACVYACVCGGGGGGGVIPCLHLTDKGIVEALLVETTPTSGDILLISNVSLTETMQTLHSI